MSSSTFPSQSSSLPLHDSSEGVQFGTRVGGVLVFVGALVGVPVGTLVGGGAASKTGGVGGAASTPCGGGRVPASYAPPPLRSSESAQGMGVRPQAIGKATPAATNATRRSHPRAPEAREVSALGMPFAIVAQ
jgi:hypothetical protein